jgi:hypothetical protein
LLSLAKERLLNFSQSDTIADLRTPKLRQERSQRKKKRLLMQEGQSADCKHAEFSRVQNGKRGEVEPCRSTSKFQPPTL